MDRQVALIKRKVEEHEERIAKLEEKSTKKSKSEIKE